MKQITMAIEGMSCGGCVDTVSNAIRAVPGVRVDKVSVGSATVSYDPSRTSVAAIARAIRDAGYEPTAAGRPVVRAVGGASGGCCGGGRSSGSCCN